jgi:lysophospholipase L1-like esterase
VTISPNVQFLMQERRVFDGSGIAESSPAVAQRMISDTARHNWVTVIWCGHNDLKLPDQVKADIARMIGALSPGNDRYVIVSLMNPDRPTGIKGGALYPFVLQLNADLQALYPGHFLDVRNPLVAMYNPNDPVEVQDHLDDVCPTHLRSDDIHFRQEGSAIVAGMIRAFILQHGW